MNRILSLAILLAPIAAISACSGSDNLSTKDQLITCDTDPSTGVVLRCEPATGDDHGGANQCQDVDTNGDGEPSDDGTAPGSVARHGGSDDGSGSGDDNEHPNGDDDDGDGIPNGEDCDTHPGEDDHGGVDLPYDVRPGLGATTNPIFDAFAEKGAQPASIVSVTMDGSDWRLTEVTSGTAFVVTQADCDHAGNRGTGRDRIVVTWANADGSTDSDHLDLRYCQ
ncbi:MAG TPA: hypothetical protein VGM90_17620 [Kofleriaceae bacterium]|jgi:hypothetical protein